MGREILRNVENLGIHGIIYLLEIKMTAVPEKDRIEYTVALVSDFAKKYSLSTTQAFNYLDRFNAITLLDQHYNIAHTLAFSEMIDTLASYCKDHGGTL